MQSASDVVFLSAGQLSSGGLSFASYLLDNGYSVKFLGQFQYFSQDQIRRAVNNFIINESQLLAISITFFRSSADFEKLINFISLAKEKIPNIRIIIGGTTSVDIYQYFSEEDKNIFVILGQNRETEALSLFNKLSGRLLIKPFDFRKHKIHYNELITNIPNIPKHLFMTLEISRGCIFNCTFCNASLRKTKSTFKDEEQIISELEHFYKLTNNPIVLLSCNTFNDNLNKIKTMISACEKLSFTPKFFAFTRFDLFQAQPEYVKQFYKKYVKFIHFGIETFYPASLKSINKPDDIEAIKQFLINFRQYMPDDCLITGSFIIGLPEEPITSMFETAKWLKENNVLDRNSFYALVINSVQVTKKRTLIEHSEFDLNAEEYGYSLFSMEQFKKQLRSNMSVSVQRNLKQLENLTQWVRPDGFSFLDAVSVTDSINNSFNNSFCQQNELIQNMSVMSMGTNVALLKARDLDRKFSDTIFYDLSVSINKYIDNII